MRWWPVYNNDIVAGLYNALGIPVIYSPSSNNQPPFPYIGYSITMRYSDFGHGNDLYELVPSTNPGFDQDFLESVELQPESMYSFTAYSQDQSEAFAKAKEAWDWFRLKGIDYLRSKGITVVEVMSIQNRDQLEVDEYTRREGFDVRIRFDDLIENRIETIESYTIKEVQHD